MLFVVLDLMQDSSSMQSSESLFWVQDFMSFSTFLQFLNLSFCCICSWGKWLCKFQTSSITMGSNSTVNDDVSDKTRDSFTHKECNCGCEGCDKIDVSLFIMNMFSKVKNQV